MGLGRSLMSAALCQRRKGHEPSPGLGIERQDARTCRVRGRTGCSDPEKQAGYVALGQVAGAKRAGGQRVARQPDMSALPARTMSTKA